jgi:7,8-dihydropterin-6-yl-methyl-4-(beta-D-ribofuranosyl)aminobenzene 5'-phosphate synthase
MNSLTEIDSLELVVIIDNELDVLSKPEPNTVVSSSGNIANIGLGSPANIHHRGECSKEIRMDSICCAAHGLSIQLVSISVCS